MQDFIWEIISDETPIETQMYVCDPNTCNPSSSWNDKVNINDVPLIRKKVISVKPGTSKMEITYAVTNSNRTSPIQGVAKVVMKVYSVGKVNEATTLTINNTFLNSPAGIFNHKVPLIQEFSIAPNPATTHLKVKLEIKSGAQCSISIFNVLGLAVYSQTFTNQYFLSENIDCSKFIEGAYQMAIAIDGVPTESKSFIIN